MGWQCPYEKLQEQDCGKGGSTGKKGVKAIVKIKEKAG
jgi:hypothetical protein